MSFDAVTYSHELEAALGVPPLVRANGKGPFDHDWSKGPHRDSDQWRHKLEGWTGNLALVTGEGLVGVDVDLYVEGADGSWDSLTDRGFTRYTVTNLTGGGGCHYLYATPPGVAVTSRDLPGYPGITVKGNGGALVVPPSVHPITGRAYEWEAGWSPFDDCLVPLTLEQCELLGTGAHSERAERALDARDEEAVAILAEHFGGHSVRTRAHTIEVCRPGKERGVSAEVGYFGPGVVKVWSSSWPGLHEGIHELWQLRALAGIPGPRFEIPVVEHATFVQAARLRSRSQRWLWQDFVPSGQLSLAVGPEKIGKSTACLWIAARATRGELAGDYEGEPINVVFISAEDDAERTLKPRAVAANADLDRLFFLDPEGGGFDFAALEALGVGLAIFDPMSVYLKLTSSNEYGEVNVRTALDPFSVLAHRHDMSVVAIRHPRKSASADNVFDVVLGSRAWSAAARAVLFFTTDTQHPDRRGGLLFARGNLSRENPAHRFRLDSVLVALDEGGTTDAPLFALDEGPVGISLEDALGPREQATVREHAKDFLTETLADGRVRVELIRKGADALEISPRTLDRAKKDLHVVSEKEGFPPNQVVYWRLPDTERQQTAQDAT